MTFQPQYFGEVFQLAGDLAFRGWCHATDATLEQVLQPNYFGALVRTVRAGDLIWVALTPRSDPARPWTADPAAVRRLLLMVRPIEKGVVRVRVVMDLGSPVDPDWFESIAIAAQLQQATRVAQQAADARAAGRQPRTGRIGDGALDEDEEFDDGAASSEEDGEGGGGPSGPGVAH